MTALPDAAASSFVWRLATRSLNTRQAIHGSGPLVMGILNVTPDSFSDGGKHFSLDAAVESALQMQADGADIIDIGGESTRPYSTPVSAPEERERVVPVIQRLRSRLTIPISIDTSKAEVARAAIDEGAEIINDVTGLEGDPAMIELATRSGAGVCVMHMQGSPQTMQDQPMYQDVVSEIYEYLQQRLDWCRTQGLDPQRVCLDPGIGFGKTHAHNLTLLRNVHRFTALQRPILIGHSRKGFIGKTLGERFMDRDAGTLGVTLAVAMQGAAVVRVHEVKATVAALRMFNAARMDEASLG